MAFDATKPPPPVIYAPIHRQTFTFSKSTSSQSPVHSPVIFLQVIVIFVYVTGASVGIEYFVNSLKVIRNNTLA